MSGNDELTTYQKARLQVVGYRAVQSRVNELLSTYDLNTSQWIIVGWLYDTPDGMRVSALADVLEVEVPLVTNLLQPLQAMRLVSLRVDPEDRRAKLVRLTEKGVGLVPHLEVELARHLAVFDRQQDPQTMRLYFAVLESFTRADRQRP